MNIKKIIKHIISLCLILSILVSCTSNDSIINKVEEDVLSTSAIDTDNNELSSNEKITVQVGHRPDTFDPAMNSLLDGMSILQHLFEGLLKYDQNGNLVCGIAESYKVSSDGLTWSFRLRDNLKWSDGSKLDANDLVYTWKRVVAPTTGSSYAYQLLKEVVGYEEASKGDVDALSVIARDDRTFVVNLDSPCAYFDKICAFAILSPVKEEVVSVNGDWSETANTYISNGAYCVSKFSRDSIVLKKNKYYYDEKNVRLKEIEFNYQDNPEKTYEMYNNNEFQLIKDIPTYYLLDILDNDDFNIDIMLGTYFLLFNFKKEPFDDINVRKAMSLAIDRNHISNNIMHSTSKVAKNFVGPGISDTNGNEFENKSEEMYEGSFFDIEHYDKNLEEAKRLISQAGFNASNKFPEITYVINDDGYNKDIGEYVKSCWAQLGIDVKLEFYNSLAFSKKRKNSEFDIVRSGWMCDWDDPSNILSIFETFSGHNYGKYSSSTFDHLIKEARETNVLEDHYYKLHLAERILLEDYAVIPLYYYNTYWLQKNNLKNVIYSPYGTFNFMYAYYE